MWEDFKSEWNKSGLFEKIILLLFYPIGVIIGLLVAIIWNTYGLAILGGICIILIDDTIPPEEVVAISSAVILLVKLIKFLIGKKN